MPRTYIFDELKDVPWSVSIPYPRPEQHKSRVICLLSPGQIEMLLYEIRRARDEKEYAVSDFIRDKLINVGRYYDEPTYGTPFGFFHPQLQFKVTLDGKISLEGCISENPETFSFFVFLYTA